MKHIQLMKEDGTLFYTDYKNDHPPFTFETLLKITEGSDLTRAFMFQYFRIPSQAESLLKVIDDVRECLKHDDPGAKGVASALSDMFNCISKLNDGEYVFLHEKVKRYEQQ